MGKPNEDPEDVRGESFEVTEKQQRRLQERRAEKGHNVPIRVGRKVRLGKTGYSAKLIETGTKGLYRLVVKPDEPAVTEDS